MKGHLYKKLQPEGWYVAYASDEFGFHKTELPLHPSDVDSEEVRWAENGSLEDKEVEFDWCVIVDHDSGKGKEYAKLKRQKEQTNGERFEEFMNSVQYPELEGTINLCTDIINKRAGKMTEEEWQAAERAQTSSQKEKAIQLVDSYELTLRPIFGLNDYDAERHYHKQCALIAVDQILKALELAEITDYDGWSRFEWYEVKQEIEKL